MKNIIEQYGSALISAVSGLLVIGLLFTGLLPGTGGLLKTIGKETLLMGGTAGYGASEDSDISFMKAAGAGECDLSLSQIEVENMLFVNEEYPVGSIAHTLSELEITAKVQSVSMLSPIGTGAEVTNQVISLNESGRQIICFRNPGSYRVSLIFENAAGRVVSGNYVITAENETNGELAAFA